MPALADSYSAARTVVLLEPGVVRDVAHALTGLWRPSDEDDPDRRRQLLAAARLRLYGSVTDRSGWLVVTTSAAHDRAESLGDVEWSAGFLRDLESYDDAPPAADLTSLTHTLRRESGLEAEAASTLALALLCDEVGILVARDPRRYRHNRSADLPERLAILDPVEAVRSLRLEVGEVPIEPPPSGHLLADAEPWWVPGDDEDDLRPDGDVPTFER